MIPIFRDSAKAVRFGAALGLAAGFCLLAAPSAARAEHYSLEGDRIAIYNLAGEIRIEPGDGPRVEIDLTRGGDDARDLNVERGRIGDRQTLRVRYPGSRVIYPPMGKQSSASHVVNEDGTFHGGKDGWGGRKVVVAGSGSGSGTEAWADLVVRVPKGTDLAVFLLAGAAEAEDVECALRIEDAAGSVTAHGVRGNLALDTGSGSVDVQDIEGEVALDTGSGSVTIENVNGPRLSADTGSGSIRIDRAVVGELLADTGSGGMTLQGIKSRRIVIETGSGHVDLGLASGCEKLTIDTGSGGVTLRVPETYGARYEIDTGSGGIAVDVPHEKTRAEHDHESGRIGDGRGSLAIDTGSGGVKVVRGAR